MYLIQKRTKKKTGGGVWYLVEKLVDPETGKVKQIWRSTKTTDRRAAEAVLREVEAGRGIITHANAAEGIKRVIIERATAISTVLAPSHTSFAEAWQIYLQEPRTKGCTPGTLRRMTVIWQAFTKWCGLRGLHSVDVITWREADQYLKECSPHLAFATLKTMRAGLHSIFARLRRPLNLFDNPFDQLYIPPGASASHRCFTDVELHRIFESVTGEWRIACAIATNTGLRFGDICTLKVLEISIADKWIHRIPEKTKRFNRITHIPIQDDLAELLRAQIAGKSTDDWVLPELADGYLRRNHHTRVYFKQLLDTLGITSNTDGTVGFHSFRHTFNTRLINAGVDEGVRLRIMGHSQLGINQIYNHADEAARIAVSKAQLPVVAYTRLDSIKM